MRRLLSLVLTVLLVGCASSGSSTGSSRFRGDVQNVSVQWTGGNLDLRTTHDIVVASDTVAMAPRAAWSGLRAVYDSLDVPVNMVNTRARALGAVRVRVRGRLGGERLSHYLHCGRTITGNAADEQDVQLTLVSQISPLPGGERSVLSSHLAAVAIRRSVSSGGTRCSSRGRLEDEIRERLLLPSARGGS